MTMYDVDPLENKKMIKSLRKHPTLKRLKREGLSDLPQNSRYLMLNAKHGPMLDVEMFKPHRQQILIKKKLFALTKQPKYLSNLILKY